jgi:hypothetical protein
VPSWPNADQGQCLGCGELVDGIETGDLCPGCKDQFWAQLKAEEEKEAW